MSHAPNHEPDPLALEAAARATYDAVVADPALADDIRAVLAHLRSAPLDPVGDPG